MIKHASRALLLGLALGLAGCSAALTSTPPSLYVLQPKTTYDTNLPVVSYQLVVTVPDAPQSLDTARIALARSPTTIDYFASSAWTDRAPVMVQDLLVESFENTRKIVSVGRDTSGLRADYVLLTDLRDFEARYYEGTNKPPQVRVRLTAKLIKMPEREIIGGLDAVKLSDAEHNDIDSIVAAFGEATGNAMKMIVQWTLRTAPATGAVAVKP
ncbi:MAG TPA: ABC-type transport auxiliary lipoprotein family protein [Aliidongia sp.]|uniref:ABC-type transport auxiliary lipoprotein family protein n=1 Tax=Aliidongia sp. TaxID=1914230 RepID=UPI002DDD2548|nr:ABC-type transport auxiliary lipoprotein family protein [Aliidongia sp.]HEV2676964.1 ABC-type transport auxiliary lipoprotein family protein [Aliidongia sp.]